MSIVSNAKAKGVRFASMPEIEFLHGPIDLKDLEHQEDRRLGSGLIFIPSLSKKGLIAVKNPYLSYGDG